MHVIWPTLERVSLEPDKRLVRAVCSMATGASPQNGLLAKLPYPDALAYYGTPSRGDVLLADV